MRLVNTFLLAASVSLNMLLTLLLSLSFAYYVKHEVFDIDLIRSQYVVNVRYWLQYSCEEGTYFVYERTDLPPKYGEEGDTPTSYCDKYVEGKEEAILNQVMELGRKQGDK